MALLNRNSSIETITAPLKRMIQDLTTFSARQRTEADRHRATAAEETFAAESKSAAAAEADAIAGRISGLVATGGSTQVEASDAA